MGRRLESRDTAFLERLYREHQRRVRWVLRGRGIASDELDDVVHDAFLAIHRRQHQRDPALPESVWISGVARSVAFAYRRGDDRRRRTHEQSPEPPARPLPDEEVARREAWHKLERFLDGLNEGQREAFVMIDLVGMQASEVAAISGTSANTTSSRLRLARRRFERNFAGDTVDRTRLLRAAGAGERPTAASRRQTWGAIAASIGLPTPPVVGTIANPIAAGTTALAKWATVFTIAVGSVAAVTRPWEGQEPQRTTDKVEQASSRTMTRAGSVEVQLSAAAPVLADPPFASPPPAHGPRSAATDASAAAGERPTDPAHSDTPGPNARQRAAPRRPPRPPTGGATKSRSRGIEAPDLGPAIALLREAETARAAGNPSKALHALDRYRRRFPADPLGRERSRVEWLAACSIGDSVRAETARHDLVTRGIARANDVTCP